MKTVLLATLESRFQASILQGALKNEGIESFFTNDVVSSVFGNITGFQIEILVFEEDYERAMEILKEGFPRLIEG